MDLWTFEFSMWDLLIIVLKFLGNILLFLLGFLTALAVWLWKLYYEHLYPVMPTFVNWIVGFVLVVIGGIVPAAVASFFSGAFGGGSGSGNTCSCSRCGGPLVGSNSCGNCGSWVNTP
ncbi:MAG: hypothetical protein KDJ38_00185 [Gammaproteobacteria bacterium]|nr:hypothetical protein [Gammaproteobacteria bacterium]